jgi:peptidoglycan/LPS O-acetylase OafA/YrhL
MPAVTKHFDSLKEASVSRISAPRVPELDGLRGLAISLVIICHYIAASNHASLWSPLRHLLSALNVGWSGVDLFFVLSGFLIGGILLDARASPNYFRAFYMRRVFRILPFYSIWILLYALIILAGPALSSGALAVSSKDFLQIPIRLLFLQNIWIDMTPLAWIWFVATWSLAVEEQFYLLVPPLIRFLSLRNLTYVLLATICMAPLLRFLVFRYWSPGTYLASFLMFCRADALACGVLLALAWRQPEFRTFLGAHRRALQGLMVILSFGVLVMLHWLVGIPNLVIITIGYSWFAILYSTLLLVAVSQTDGPIAAFLRWKILGQLGTISYGLYVIHYTFNQLAHQFLLHASPQINGLRGVGVTLMALFVSLAVATASWRYFERPLVRRGHHYSFWTTASAAFTDKFLDDKAKLTGLIVSGPAIQGEVLGEQESANDNGPESGELIEHKKTRGATSVG